MRVAMAVDPRISEVWACLFSQALEPEELAAQVGWFLRMAYLHGYHDALSEPEPGALYRHLGMRAPPRRRARTRRPRATGSDSTAPGTTDRKEAS
jgi:hypothetical protein